METAFENKSACYYFYPTLRRWGASSLGPKHTSNALISNSGDLFPFQVHNWSIQVVNVRTKRPRIGMEKSIKHCTFQPPPPPPRPLGLNDLDGYITNLTYTVTWPDYRSNHASSGSCEMKIWLSESHVLYIVWCQKWDWKHNGNYFKPPGYLSVQGSSFENWRRWIQSFEFCFATKEKTKKPLQPKSPWKLQRHSNSWISLRWLERVLVFFRCMIFKS